MRHAVTQPPLKHHQLKLVWKTCEMWYYYKITTIIIIIILHFVSSTKYWKPNKHCTQYNNEIFIILKYYDLFNERIKKNKTFKVKQFQNKVFCIRLNKDEAFWEDWFGLVWFYGISTIVSYLMPNPFLFYFICSPSHHRTSMEEGLFF